MIENRTWSGARLKALREQQGLTQEGLARAADTKLRNIPRWELNRNIPGANHVIALADALGVDPGEFYENGKEEEAA